jgi:signal peptidase I
MGFFGDRRILKEARRARKTVRAIMRGKRGALDEKAAAQLERDLAEVDGAVAARDAARAGRATSMLQASFDRHLAFAKKSIVREYAEAFAFAILLALFIRTFFIQLFKIPTGSMEPTLHGAQNHRGFGDHIVVNKFIYGPQTLDWIGIPRTNIGVDIPTFRFSRLALRAPRRGDIIVFRFPFDALCNNCQRDFNLAGRADRACPYCGSLNVERQNKDFVKRCIGLPGETIEIRDGHIYADGRRVASPREVADIYYRNISPSQGPYGHVGQRITVPKDSYFVLGDNSANSKDSRFWGFVPFQNVRGLSFFIYLPPSRIGVVR